MATDLFFRQSATSDMHRGTNSAKLDGNTSGWRTRSLVTSRGFTSTSTTTNTVTGPTNGVEVVGSSYPLEWITAPLAADVTISGTITLNIWALENNMSANVAINAIIERLDNTGAIVSTIAQTARTTELGTTAAAANFTVTPTSTNMLKGDRIRVRIYGDDSTANMGSGYTFTVHTDASSAGTTGDSYITFTENLTFGSIPAQTLLYLTDVAGPAVGSLVEKEMWTSRGGSVATAIANTQNGWTAPSGWTASIGGSQIEWYSKPLTAFTLAGVIEVSLPAVVSNASAQTSIRAEIAITNKDGSGAVIWGATGLINSSGQPGVGVDNSRTGVLTTTEGPNTGWIAGSDVSVTDGQRIRLRIYLDDTSILPSANGYTATLYYNGSSSGGSGDSYLRLPQAVTEFVASVPFKQYIIPRNQAVRRAAYW